MECYFIPANVAKNYQQRFFWIEENYKHVINCYIENMLNQKRVFIPILGGPSAGKTVFMFAVVRKLIEDGKLS